MFRLRLCLALFLTCCVVFPVRGHETDQFTIPDEREWADIGPELSRWFYDRMERAVDKTNASIASGAGSDLSVYHSGEYMAQAVNRELPWAMDVIEGFDKMSMSEEMYHRYPGRVVGFKEPFENILQHNHFILDPRQFFRLFLSCTIKAYGVYFGSDKIGHFTDMGMNYYREYAKARADGMEPEAAEIHATQMGQRGLIFSERGMLGFMTAGAYSNGDLAANYVGLLFYRNLTEPVMLKGEVRPPMLVRDGDFWRFNTHVRRDSDFFAWFVSEHFDEALNPSLFEGGMRNAVRRQVRDRAPQVLRHYADRYGNIRPPQYFDNKVMELSTYHGRDYGHMGALDELVAIGNTCYTEEAQYAALRPTVGEKPLFMVAGAGNPTAAEQLVANGTDLRGRTALHLAAGDARVETIAGLLDSGADANAADTKGRTALHYAADAGNARAAAELLSRGAKAEARDRFNTTPLHLAARQQDVALVQQLIEKGASVNAEDDFGIRPLHDAARAGADRAARFLIRAGADVNARDDYGTTALHLACRDGRSVMAQILIDAGADVNAASAAGTTPLHEAALSGDKATNIVLLKHSAVRDPRNRRNQTPAAIAQSRNHTAIPEILSTWRP